MNVDKSTSIIMLKMLLDKLNEGEIEEAKIILEMVILVLEIKEGKE